MADSSSEGTEEKITKVAFLKPGSRRVNLIVKCVEKKPAKTVTSKRDGSTHVLQEVLVGDDTGCIFLTLWNDQFEVEESQVILINNGYTNLFKGSLRLSVGRYGKISYLEGEDIEVNTDVNVSNRNFGPRGTYKRPVDMRKSWTRVRREKK